MGNQPISRFRQKQQWVILSKKGCKEVIQNKCSGQVVERYTLEHIDAQEIKREEPIYQWRTNKKAVKFTVEIYQMKYSQFEDENECYFKLCHKPEQENHKLIIFTEHIHKLYENYNKFQFNDKEQIKIFADICHGIDQLSQKFGYFMISKEMIGYNSKMVGKVWINENFASNYAQYKRQIQTKNDRQKWQSSIIDNLIDICRLCTTELNSKSNKFEHVISQIRDNRLFSFELFLRYSRKVNHCDFEREGMSSMNKRFSSQQKSYKVLSNECSKQIGNSNGKSIKEVISSTKDCKDTKLVKQKRFVMVPVVNIKKIYQVSEQQRQFLDSQMRKSESYGSQLRPNSVFLSPVRQNYVQVERQTQSYMKKSDQIYRIKSQISKPLDSILEYPQHTAQKYNDKSGDMAPGSSLNSSRQQILLVDSMIVVENDMQKEQLVRKNTKIILEESVIIRGQQNE